MTNLRTLTSCCCFAVLCLGGSMASAAVTITNGSIYALVHENATENSDAVYNGEYYIDGGTGSASALGVPGFLSQCDRIVSGDAITHNFEQMRKAGLYDYALGEVYTYIEVDFDTPFSLSGSFTNSAGYTDMYTVLIDISLNTLLYRSALSNSADAPYSAVVGGTDGNQGYTLEGSESGILLAGHTYQFYSYAHTFAYPSADDGATATGEITLQFGDPDVEIVPEPASITVWSCLGLTAIIGLRRSLTPSMNPNGNQPL
jgi:hypothetical protein